MKLRQTEPFPEIRGYLFDDEKHDQPIIDFYVLILEAAQWNHDRAFKVFQRLYSADIRCIADFDCTPRSNMLNMSGIGPIYGGVIKRIFELRVRNIREELLRCTA